VRLGHIVLSADAAYENFPLAFTPGYSPHAVVVGVAAGWAF
jgi:hypothetical protein